MSAATRRAGHAQRRPANWPADGAGWHWLRSRARSRAPLGRDALRRAGLRGRRRFRWRRLAGELEELAAAFHRRHEELYTYAQRDQEAVLVNARVAVAGVLPALPHEPGRSTMPPVAARTRRRIYLGDRHEVPVFDVEALCPGQSRTAPRSWSRPPPPCCGWAITPARQKSAGSISPSSRTRHHHLIPDPLLLPLQWTSRRQNWSGHLATW